MLRIKLWIHLKVLKSSNDARVKIHYTSLS
jgi:hypothetical protein